MEDCAIVDHKTETEMSSAYISAFMNLVELIMVIALNTEKKQKREDIFKLKASSVFALFDEAKKLWNSYWNFTRNNNIHVNTLKYTVIEIFYQTIVSSKGFSTICQNVILEIFFTGSGKLFHK